MGILYDIAGIGAFGSLMGGYWGVTPTSYFPGIAAQQQQMALEFQQQQAQEAQEAQGIAAMQLPPYIPQRKNIESKIIETVVIRPEQDVKLLKAGKGI